SAARLRQGEPAGGGSLRAGQAECGRRKPGQRLAPDRLGAIGSARVKARVVGGAPGERGSEPAPRCRFDEMAGYTNCAGARLEQGRAKANQVDIAAWFIFSAHRTRKSAQTSAILCL